MTETVTITQQQQPPLQGQSFPTQREDHGHCLICYDELSYRTMLPCHHNDICPICSLRIRYLHKDVKCPICKQENERVIVDHDTTKKASFEEYPLWGDELGSDFSFDSTAGMFFPAQYYQDTIQPLLGYQCWECDEYDGTAVQPGKSPLKSLQEHLKTQHRLALCNLCTENQRDFVSALPRLTPTQMQAHLRGKDGSGGQGHPVCEFCRPKRFYDLATLHVHLNREHYKCDLCDRAGLPHQYFKNYNSLQRHFDAKHFLCHDAGCLQARFVVFDSELDLRHHERQVHGATSTGSSKIALEFRYNTENRRGPNSALAALDQQVPSAGDFDYSLDGQAFVPDAPVTAMDATNDDNPATCIPATTAAGTLHQQRTALLRERAAQLAMQNGLVSRPAEAFPTLGADGEGGGEEAESPGTQLRAGWNSGATVQRVAVRPVTRSTVGQVTDSAFPALGGGGTKRPGVVAARTNNTTTTSTTFAAIHRAASTPTPTYSGSSNGNWSSSGGATSGAPSVATAVAPTARKAAPNVNSADQFPSLGGGSKRPGNAALARPAAPAAQPYAAANALARQHRLQQQQQQAAPGREAFPSLGGGSVPKPAPPPSPPKPKSPPQLNSAADFPPPPGAAASATAAKSSVQDVKSILGKQKYKELKRLTTAFAQGDLQGRAFVDMAAALFGDDNKAEFLTFVPSLVESCPASPGQSAAALRYLEQLQQSRSKKSLPQPTRSAVTATKRNGSGGNTASAWGGGAGGGGSSVARAKAGSVSLAAAQQQQRPQTATSFMAQEQKREAAKHHVNSNKKKNSTKQELRKLAYGGV